MNPARKHPSFKLLAMAALASIVITSCELLGDTTLPDYASITDISYARHVQVLFDDACTSCHDGADDELLLTSWAHVQDGTASGGVVIPFEPDRSRLIRMLTTRAGGAHPTELGEDPLSVAEVEFLTRWIDQGARNDLGQVPYSDDTPRALVAVEAEALIAVVDVDRLAISRLIDLVALGFDPDSRPVGLTAVADGSGWFVSLPGENVVLRFDSQDVLNGIAEIDNPGALSTSTDGAWLVVGRAAGDTSGRVDIVSTQDMRVHSVESVFPVSAASATRPHGDYGFSASRTADQIVLFKLDAGGPSYIAMSGPRHAVDRMITNPEGDRLIALGSESGAAIIMDITTPAFIRELGSIDLGSSIRSAALVGGSLLAIDDEGRLRSVDPIPGATPNLIAQIEQASGVAGTGTRILVIGDEDDPSQVFRDVAHTGFIRVLDAGSGAVLRSIEIDGRPTAVVVR